MIKQIVALLFHVPGLYAVYGYKPDRRTVGLNILALSITALLAVFGYAWDGFRLSLLFFSLGHFAWGAFLVAKVRAI